MVQKDATGTAGGAQVIDLWDRDRKIDIRKEGAQHDPGTHTIDPDTEKYFEQLRAAKRIQDEKRAAERRTHNDALVASLRLRKPRPGGGNTPPTNPA